MSDHAFLSPSASYRWMVCPMSPHHEADMPDEPSFAARRGELGHEIACARLTIGTSEEVEKNCDRTLIDNQLLEHVQEYVDFVLALSSGADLAEYETRLKIPIHEECWGTADAVILKGDELHVADAKFGFHFVPEANNPQLMLYGYGALREYEHLGIESIHLHIVQPQTGDPRVHVMRVNDLVDWALQVAALAASRAMNPQHQYSPGSACTWCRYRWHCAPRALYALEQMRALPSPDQPLTMDKVLHFVDIAAHLRSFLSDMEDRAYEELMQGHVVPGWKLVEKLGNRQWIDEKAAQRELKKLGIAQSALYEKKFLSPAKVEKLLPKEERTQIESLVVRPPSTPRMVREENPRPAIIRSTAADDFQESEE